MRKTGGAREGMRKERRQGGKKKKGYGRKQHDKEGKEEGKEDRKEGRKEEEEGVEGNGMIRKGTKTVERNEGGKVRGEKMRKRYENMVGWRDMKHR